MQRMNQSIQAICLWNLEPQEKRFLSAYLEWRSIRPVKLPPVSSLAEYWNKEDLKQENFCLILEEPSESRISELIQFGLEILFLGKSSLDKKKEWVRLGVTRYIESTEFLNQLPIYFPQPNSQSMIVAIYSGETWLDQLLVSFFRSNGQKTINPLSISQFFPLIQKEKPDLVILDWDHFLDKDNSFFQKLENYTKNTTLPIILGIKDYDKQGLSNDIIKGISKYSSMSFPKKRILPALLFSLRFQSNKRINLREFQTIHWENPARGKLQSVKYEFTKYPDSILAINDWEEIWRWFEWLQDEALFH